MVLDELGNLWANPFIRIGRRYYVLPAVCMCVASGHRGIALVLFGL